jgi:signal transduction histidine kinase
VNTPSNPVSGRGNGQPESMKPGRAQSPQSGQASGPGPDAPARLRAWPRTLVARLFVIFLVGLVLAHAMSFALLFYERYDSAKSVMLNNLERDLVMAIGILDKLPPGERAAWLPRLDADNRTYMLTESTATEPLTSSSALTAAHSIETALKSEYPLTVLGMAGDPKHIQARVQLSDGQPVTIDMQLQVMPLARWLPAVLLAQLALLVACAWIAVRVAVRPLSRLADAADTMDPNRKSPRLNETGPAEVAHAAKAFNTMQDRISAHLAERMQILGAISHDLQTPITRMKLRSEFMEDSVDKEKLTHDLNEVERLVREGVAYARSAHGVEEKAGRIDVDAFLDSLVCDYQDTGKDVSLSGSSSTHLVTRPHALRRILGNLVDNALKYAGSAEVAVQVVDGNHGSGGHGGRHTDAISICVQDYGPGIPPAELEAVLQPFYRLENSRNRDTGGTGLGLAIAQQLATAIGATLTLRNREGGGLSVELLLPAAMETTGS